MLLNAVSLPLDDQSGADPQKKTTTCCKLLDFLRGRSNAVKYSESKHDPDRSNGKKSNRVCRMQQSVHSAN
jgi:hypothetical protein